jgi:tryptophanase
MGFFSSTKKVIVPDAVLGPLRLFALIINRNLYTRNQIHFMPENFEQLIENARLNIVNNLMLVEKRINKKIDDTKDEILKELQKIVDRNKTTGT